MPTRLRIELDVARVALRVKGKQPIEAHHVECKADWPTDHADAARAIAAHANATSPEDFLWVIGLQERPPAITGASALEFSNWWAQVRKHFEGSPPVPTDVIYHYDDIPLVGICFTSDGAPYVVKNPDFAERKTKIAYEVPFRIAHSVNTATRSQLLQIFASSLVTLPELEILEATLLPDYAFLLSSPPRLKATFSAKLYLAPLTQARVDFPFHRNQLELRFGRSAQVLTPLRLEVPPPVDPRAVPISLPPFPFNRSTSHELLLAQPGLVYITEEVDFGPLNDEDAALLNEESQPQEALAILRLRIVGVPRHLTIQFPLAKRGEKYDYLPPEQTPDDS